MTAHGGVGDEFAAFVKRNGVSAIFFHLIELYAGWLLRSLPGPEGIWLRGGFYRLLFKRAGRGLLIYPGCYLIFCRNISVGQRVAMNVRVYLDGRGGIELGNNVMIGPGSVMSSCEHGFADLTRPMSEQPIRYAKIVIEDDVWIGANAVIRSGVTVGRGSIVGAGAVVTKNVPPYSVVGGVPAKLIRSRLPEAVA